MSILLEALKELNESQLPVDYEKAFIGYFKPIEINKRRETDAFEIELTIDEEGNTELVTVKAPDLYKKIRAEQDGDNVWVYALDDLDAKDIKINGEENTPDWIAELVSKAFKDFYFNHSDELGYAREDHLDPHFFQGYKDWFQHKNESLTEDSNEEKKEEKSLTCPYCESTNTYFVNQEEETDPDDDGQGGEGTVYHLFKHYACRDCNCKFYWYKEISTFTGVLIDEDGEDEFEFKITGRLSFGPYEPWDEDTEEAPEIDGEIAEIKKYYPCVKDIDVEVSTYHDRFTAYITTTNMSEFKKLIADGESTSNALQHYIYYAFTLAYKDKLDDITPGVIIEVDYRGAHTDGYL